MPATPKDVSNTVRDITRKALEHGTLDRAAVVRPAAVGLLGFAGALVGGAWLFVSILRSGGGR